MTLVILSLAQMRAAVIFGGELIYPCYPCMVGLRRGHPAGVRGVGRAPSLLLPTAVRATAADPAGSKCYSALL